MAALSSQYGNSSLKNSYDWAPSRFGICSLSEHDTAIVDTIAKVSNFHELPTGAAAVDGKLYTRLEQVMVKEKGAWQVASFHNVPIQPKFVDDSVRSLTATDAH